MNKDIISQYEKQNLFSINSEYKQPYLYHHSSSKKIQNIIKSKTLRAYNLKSFLEGNSNDNNEFLHIIQIIEQVVEFIIKEKGLAKKLNELALTIKKDILKYKKNFFVLCFTYDKNNIHCETEFSKNKFHITFKETHSLCKKHSEAFYYAYVIYSPAIIEDAIKKEINSFIDIFLSGLDIEQLKRMIALFFRKLTLYAALYKRPHPFEKEKEYRFIMYNDQSTKDNYLELKLTKTLLDAIEKSVT